MPEPLLSVRNAGKIYARRHWLGHGRETTALEGISFDLARGRTLALVGPSGAGKSTLARLIAGFEAPTTGEICIEGRRVAGLQPQVQLVFQEPAASLNPRFTAAEIVCEPLVIQKRGGRGSRARLAAAAMEKVGLPGAELDRHALEFSGGERQRLALARALVLEPRLLILDESFVGLDLSAQAQAVHLLLDLQERLGLTYILISHDLALAGQLADEIAVIESGRIVEHAPAREVFAHPQHPRTRELLEAALALAPGGLPV